MRLQPGEIEIWCARPGDLVGAEATRSALLLLAPEEVRRYERYRFDRDRQRYLATRMLVRTVLSHYVPQPLEGWRFTIGPHGRPEIANLNPWELRFNLSRTKGLVVCAVTRRYAIGIDVERVRPDAPLEVANRFFAASESAELCCLPPAERGRRFYDYWTLKESYLKARGLGLSVPLESFAFRLKPGCSPQLTVDPSLNDDTQAWQFEQIQPKDEYSMSVCVGQSEPIAGKVSVSWISLSHAYNPVADSLTGVAAGDL